MKNLTNVVTTAEPLGDAANDDSNAQRGSDDFNVFSVNRNIARQQNEQFREKVLTRKRKRSKHPLRDLRLAAGFTLEDLAQMTNLSPSYLSRLESGSRRLNADIIHRLSVALGCNPGELLPTANVYSFMRTPEDAENTGTGPRISASGAPADLPVYSLTGTSSGSGIINTGSADTWMPRPAELFGVMGAFACLLREANFGSRYNNNDKILLNPTTPLTANCSVLAVTTDNKAYIGRFVGWVNETATSDPVQLIMEVTTGTSAEAPKSEKTTFERAQLKGTYRIIGCLEAND